MNLEKILNYLGPFPEKCPTKGKVIESIAFEDYIRETIAYNVEKEEVVHSYLLRPVKNGVYPAIICHHQHHSDRVYGKDEPAGLIGNKDLYYAEELVKLGYITFVPDSLAYGERRNKEEPLGYNYWEMATRLVQGKTLLAKNLHDLSQGIDYLESRGEVKKNRIGFIGHSFGGRMGIWAAAYDHRIKAIVCNCGCISYQESMTEDTGIQLEFVIQGIAKELDIEDVLKEIEPNNVLISASTKDKWCRGVNRVYEEARPYFRKGNIELALYEGNHEFRTEMREKAYDYLDRFLKI